MITWKDFVSLRVFKTLYLMRGSVIKTKNADGTETTLDLAELASLNNLSAASLAKINGVTNGTPAAGKALVADASVGIGAFRFSARNLQKQAAPAAKTTAVTLTAAEIMVGLITANQGGAAAANYTLPLASALETALLLVHPGLANDDSFDFALVNISTVAAEDITVVTNTGMTLVGSMVVASNAAATDISSATFRVRRTGANAYSVYRLT